MRKNVVLLATLVVCVAIPRMAHGDAMLSVGGSFTCPSNSCLGGAYTLTFTGNNTGNTFVVTLTATTPGSTSGSPAFGDYISNVNFSDGQSISSVTLVGATAGGPGSWSSTSLTNLNNAGCSGSSMIFACNSQLPNGGMYTLAKADGSTYSWTWDVTFAGALDTNPADMHIGLQYENGPNTSNGLIVSESGPSTHIPEPGSASLLGLGLAGLAGFARRCKTATKL